MDDLEEIQKRAVEQADSCESLSELEALKVKYLGKKGLITSQMKMIGSLEANLRKEFGAKVNLAKQTVATAIDVSKKHLLELQMQKQLDSEKIDVTLPARAYKKGSKHLITQTIEECCAIFNNMGFVSEQGPEIEDDFNNFTALNIPEDHPARQMQDTFYLNGKDEEAKNYILRTHTSSVQIRKMKNSKPPFKIIAPGRVYRSDYDMTHTPMFHQIEGLYVDKQINMGHLKGCLNDFLKAFFELEKVPLRFRPSFFPFTEPSAEVDIGCVRKNGEVKIGGSDGWLEILGCGMVHPNVLKNVNVDPEQYQGFAFGVGIERLAMLKYGAPDLRSFFDGDIRWLKHYGF